MNKNVFQAVREAMGDDYLPQAEESAIAKRANELKSVYPDANKDEVLVEAIKEAKGGASFSPNVQVQVKNRAKELNKHGGDQAETVSELSAEESTHQAKKDNKPNLGDLNNSGPNVGTDVGKERFASIVGDETAFNAKQKADFEKSSDNPAKSTNFGSAPKK